MRKNTNPMRAVEKPYLRVGSSLFMKGGTPKFYFWELRLACGHTVERRCRYKPGGARGWGRIWHGTSRDRVLDPPKRVRCEECVPV